ncbi:hypothetical protein GUJ93_ZPchr0001g29361 [Zizania palustris]|uniref:NAC domain-containing protein n=1 Tax=Zizania palustris TaxID=103762 RepID=A0A8J5RRP7_ZIZPA|nr:hypothetical protein GUJ93_ZPchr0001g29361 [Zizania palustris]
MVIIRSDEAEPTPDFGSHPTDAELVTTYLRPWAESESESGEYAWPYVHRADVYSADPEELTRGFAPAIAADGAVAWYFFTNLRSKSGGGQRKARTVETGEGCWHSEGGPKSVVAGVNRTREVGRRQFFSFVRKEGSRRVRSGWIMVEIGLNYGRRDNPSDELVLCKVYRSPRAPVDSGARKTTVAPAPAAMKSKAVEEAPTPEDTKPVLVSALPLEIKVPTAAPAATGCKRKTDGKSSGAGRTKVRCSRCHAETSESDSETVVLDDAPNEDETADSSEIRPRRHYKFIQFL